MGAKNRGANIYPSYNKIRVTKERCYPEGIEVSEVDAFVPLQNLLDHTLNRLMQTMISIQIIGKLIIKLILYVNGSVIEAQAIVNIVNVFLIIMKPKQM